MTVIRPRRSVLYMPGSNARALEKAKTLPADALILDLEDAVAPDAKDLARKQAEVVRKLAPDHFSAGGRAEKSGASWRTRFTGSSESSARAACKALKARGQPCMVLPPSA
jgi:hypothetical protein